jgi:hypothetical protein
VLLDGRLGGSGGDSLRPVHNSSLRFEHLNFGQVRILLISFLGLASVSSVADSERSYLLLQLLSLCSKLGFNLQHPSFHVSFTLCLKLFKPLIEVLLHLFRLLVQNAIHFYQELIFENLELFKLWQHLLLNDHRSFFSQLALELVHVSKLEFFVSLHRQGRSQLRNFFFESNYAGRGLFLEATCVFSFQLLFGNWRFSLEIGGVFVFVIWVIEGGVSAHFDGTWRTLGVF